MKKIPKILSFALILSMLGTFMPMTATAGASSNNRTESDTTIDEFCFAQTPPLMTEDTEYMEIELDSKPTIGFRATGGLQRTMYLRGDSNDILDNSDIKYHYNWEQANSSYQWDITPTALGHAVITAYNAASDYKAWDIEVVHTHTIKYLDSNGQLIDTITAKQTADTTPTHITNNDSFFAWEIVSLGDLYNGSMKIGDILTLDSTFDVADDITLKGIVVHTVTYTDGVDDVEIFADEVTHNILPGTATPAFNGSEEREGYVFNGWSPAVADTVTEDAVYTATWTKITEDDTTTEPDTKPGTGSPEPSTPEPSTPEPSTPETSTPEPSSPEPSIPETSTPEPSSPQTTAPQTGDYSNILLCFTLAILSLGGVILTLYKRKLIK